VRKLKKNIPIFKLDKLVEIIGIYVTEEYRGQKISSKLVKKCKIWAKEKGIKKICLTVLPDNKNAIKAYDSMGFSNFLLEMRANL